MDADSMNEAEAMMEATAPAGEVEADSAMDAAYKFVDSIAPRADGMAGGFAPWWHAWALREAFMAGTKHAALARRGEDGTRDTDRLRWMAEMGAYMSANLDGYWEVCVSLGHVIGRGDTYQLAIDDAMGGKEEGADG